MSLLLLDYLGDNIKRFNYYYILYEKIRLKEEDELILDINEKLFEIVYKLCKIRNINTFFIREVLRVCLEEMIMNDSKTIWCVLVKVNDSYINKIFIELILKCGINYIYTEEYRRISLILDNKCNDWYKD